MSGTTDLISSSSSPRCDLLNPHTPSKTTNYAHHLPAKRSVTSMTGFKRPPSPTSSSSQPAAKRSTQAAGLFALPGSASRSPASSIAGYTSRRHVPGPVKRASEIGATKQRATSTREKGAEVLVLSDDSEEEVKVRGGKEEKGKGKAPARPNPDPEDQGSPTSRLFPSPLILAEPIRTLASAQMKRLRLATRPLR